MKKVICAFLAVLLLVSLLPSSAVADALPYEGKTVILATGNIRGEIDVYPQIMALKTDYEAKGAEVVLVDTGNFLQGSAYANSDRGFSVYALMDACGYDVANLGLAEFSYTDATTGYPYHGNFHRYYTQKMLQDGTEEIRYNVNKDGTVTETLPAKEPATFRAICGRFADTKNAYSFAPFAELTTVGGLKLLFLGETDGTIKDLIQDGFLDDAEPAVIETAEADLVVTLSNSKSEPTASDGELVIHRDPVEAFFVSAYVIENDSKAVTKEAVELDAADPEISQRVETIKQNAKPSLFTNTVILNGSDHLNRSEETNLGDLTTDALLWYAKNYIDGLEADVPIVAIQNGGNCDNFLYPGDVTETDLLRCLPFSPMGVGVLYVTGAQLLEALEAGTQGDDCAGFAQVSGLSYTVKRYEAYDAGEAYGKYFRADSVNRVEITEVDGRPFDPAAVYGVVADNFVLNGNDTYYVFKEAKEADGAKYLNNGGGVKTRDIVLKYVLDGPGYGVLGADYAKTAGRISIVNDRPVTVPFEDVESGRYYYDAVLWAIGHTPEITNGVDPTHFAPEQECTRGQVVTFLWRAHGCEEPTATESPFADVSGGFCFKAVLWALEQEITNGVDATHFGPEAPCTRAQVVTFLWRAAGKPADAKDSGSDMPFEDVASGAYYYEAMLWAVANEVTNGTSPTTFAPDASCTRGQVVTFLHRADAIN